MKLEGIEKPSGHKVKKLGTECRGYVYTKESRNEGSEHQYTVPKTPENGGVSRKDIN